MEQAQGDIFAPQCAKIEVNVGDLTQLFNAMDPSPFYEKDLDPNAEEFIVEWARELPPDVPLGLLVHVKRLPASGEEAEGLKAAVHENFKRTAHAARSRLRRLIRFGRTSLLIGLVFLTATLLGGEFLAKVIGPNHWAQIARESLLIGGWVAMWRPLETFLYDWWPIRDEARLFDRLSAMPVRIVYEG
jgi:hypothetical protein